MILFRRNVPRKKRKTSRGNHVFRRKAAAKSDTHRLDLNLKLETDASRRERLRRSAGFGARLAAAMLLCFVFIALMKVVVVEAFWNNPRFLLKDIAVKTAGGPLSSDAIITASGLKKGEHMLMISLRGVRDHLEALPQVQKATITRSFPGTILLEVTQRQPIAWLECPDKSVAAKVSDFGCLLDESGIVVPCDHTPTAEEKKLPVVRVDKLTRIAFGKNVESPSAIAALKLLRAQKQHPALLRMNLVRVDASRAHALYAEYASGMDVTFPVNADLDKQIHRLDLAVAEATKHHWRLATVNLLVEHNVPITLSSRSETAGTDTARHSLAAAR
jgi:hypothetical protein